MSVRNDHDLLADFARTASEAAFAELVGRHVNLVYSTALRFSGNAHAAEEITQAVFIILARKAGKLSTRVVLSGWLYQAARLTAANLARSEVHRQQREQEAYMQSTLNEHDFAAWQQIAPLLDEAMGHLGETDRTAVVLRYFENKTAQEVGAALKLTEAAAHKRVNRALEKLRKIFTKQGVTLSAVVIAGAVSANSVQAAPAGLAAMVTAAAAKGAAVSGSTLTLIKGALKIMAWTKAKTAVAAGVVVLLAAGTTTITVKEIQAHKTYPWQVPQASFGVFYKMPPMVKILPSKFAADGHWCSDGSRGAMGIAQPVQEIIQLAYRKDKLRTVIETTLPGGKYDFFAKLVPAQEPRKSIQQDEGWAAALQKEVARKFGLTGRVEKRPADVLVLQPAAAGIKGFKVSHTMPHGHALSSNAGKMQCFEQPLNTLTGVLEHEFQIPIVDRTGLLEAYDFAVTWDEPDSETPNPAGLKQALHDQLGLDLVAGREPIEMLVVEKVK
ncbi:MAG: TIGR03435 family protein [Verrucomicrobiae bacterium]|nr:TIGR03435 family protein [Verrucomicrobiae bacterium]